MPTRVLLLAGALLLTACGATGGFADDQANAAGTLEAGELAGLPTPGGAAPFGAPAQKESAVTQSFKVTGLTPQQVLDFYTSALRDQGWSASNAPMEHGENVWRGLWERNDRLLQVSAEPDSDDGTGDGDGAPTSQLDLVLRAA